MKHLSGPLSDTDIKRLHIFMTVVDCGGFSAAQVKLGLSAASISVHMAGIEAKFGVTLCKRGRAGFFLTEEGEKIYQAGKTLRLAHENFNSTVGIVKGLVVGDLHIGVIDNAVFDPDLEIPALVRRFNRIAPEVRVSLYTMSPTELERSLLEQRLHLAVGVFYTQLPGLQYYPLCTERLTLYCGEGHALFHCQQNRISQRDIAAAQYIERTYGETSSRLNHPIELNATAYTSSLEATLMLILSGDYIGFLPEYYAKQWQAQKRIRAIWRHRIFIESDVSVVVHKHPINATMTNTLLKLVLDEGD